MSPSATFVLCIENNALAPQALLLCESIRQFGGGLRNARLIAVSPRLGMGVDRTVRAHLDRLNVEYVDEPLNQYCLDYAPANRVAAGAWAEAHVDSEWLIVVDSDTVLLRELELPSSADVAARPVDVKGSTTEGPGDPLEAYWWQLAELQGVSLDVLPFVRTTIDNRLVRASYNAGLIATRREIGIFTRTADLFARSVAARLKPRKDTDDDVFSSTGFVGKAASEYWGSSQAAAALAIWSMTTRVVVYPETYNVPLHSVSANPGLVQRLQSVPVVHVHYHWMFMASYFERALATLANLGVERDRLDWLRARLPLGSGRGF